MIYTFIISAGKQSRFKSETPKALMLFKDGTSVLENNIKTASLFSDKVVVVTSLENDHLFGGFNTLPIESGFGCGDAVLKALKSFKFSKSDRVFIMWGDSIQTDIRVYQDCINNSIGDVVIPVQHDSKPYVEILADDNRNVLGAKFSKYMEPTTENGLHDLSIFYGKANSFIKLLEKVKHEIWHNGKYVCAHGNELTFLDIFNYKHTGITCKTLLCDYHEDLSFNTLEEFERKVVNK